MVTLIMTLKRIWTLKLASFAISFMQMVISNGYMKAGLSEVNWSHTKILLRGGVVHVKQHLLCQTVQFLLRTTLNHSKDTHQGYT